MSRFNRDTCLKKFLRMMRVGEEVLIPERFQKYNAVNSRICELRHEGYDFLMTCRGIAGGTRVTKLRNGTVKGSNRVLQNYK